MWSMFAVAAVVAAQLQAAPAGPPAPQAPAQQQAPGVSRTDLQRNDLSVVGREVVQVRVDFAPGAEAPRHMHPGEEIVYVLKGTLEYRLDRQPRVTLKEGDVLFIPAGTIHSVANVGLQNASELATYVVEKGKQLVVPVK
jgi:quercetin dioxygenase-like cupin family protein